MLNNGTPKIGYVRVIERNGNWDVERFGDPADAADPNALPSGYACGDAMPKRRPTPQPPATGA